MSGVGSTSGKEPDHINDEDLKSLDELRGCLKDVQKAKLSLAERATVEGCLTEVELMKQQMEMVQERLRALVGLYGTMRDEFDQFKHQRISELNVRVNGGSTTAEDIDGAIDK